MGIETMSFGKALDLLKEGLCDGITRADWYGSNAAPVVKLQRPDSLSKMTMPYLYMEKKSIGKGTVRFPIDLSCESILSDNWVILKEQK